MKPGRVVRLRINPRDCIGIADTVEKLGLKPELLTFDNACRVVLSALLESARRSNLIPERDGFEYSQMMARFELRQGDIAKKRSVGELLGTIEVARPLPGVAEERAKRERRFQELMLQYEGDPLNHPKPKPGTAEYQEWEALVLEFTQ